MFARHYDEKEGAFGRIGVISLSEPKQLFPGLAGYQNCLGSFSTMQSSLSLEILLSGSILLNKLTIIDNMTVPFLLNVWAFPVFCCQSLLPKPLLLFISLKNKFKPLALPPLQSFPESVSSHLPSLLRIWVLHFNLRELAVIGRMSLDWS